MLEARVGPVRKRINHEGSFLLSGTSTLQIAARTRRLILLYFPKNNEDKAEEQSPPKPVVLSDAGLAIIAGSDTTAIAICHIVFCLLTHPEVYMRLVEEVDRFYPAGADAFSTIHHREMVYLDAVMSVRVIYMDDAFADESFS